MSSDDLGSVSIYTGITSVLNHWEKEVFRCSMGTGCRLGTTLELGTRSGAGWVSSGAGLGRGRAGQRELTFSRHWELSEIEV